MSRKRKRPSKGSRRAGGAAAPGRTGKAPRAPKTGASAEPGAAEERDARAPRGRPVTLEELRVRPGPALAEAELPSVAVVVLNHNGRHHLDGVFDSLKAMDYPQDRLQAVLVDNASTDGSREAMRARHPWVLMLENAENRGFAGAANQGASATDAEVVAFLNNDMRVDPSWLRELVAPLVRGECQMTTSKMLSWDGKLINSAAGGMNFHGIGIQHGYLREPTPEHEVPRKTLFACGGAMACDRLLFVELGGFDEEFFAYYEDVDLGWRAWVLGHEVHYVPGSVCYHHHSSTSRTFPVETVRLLQVRNPLLACVKNYDDEHLRQVLPVALGLYLRRMLLASGIPDDGPFRIQRAQGGAGAGLPRRGPLRRLLETLRGAGARVAPGRIELTRVAAADLIGANDLLGNWGHWMRRRAEVQSRRRRADEDVFRLFLKPLWCIEDEPAYRELHDGLADLAGLTNLFAGLELIEDEPHR